ncbi:MAG: 1-acylglycerol-3-phosphate O-acyltransferase [Hahellaceae bacterium]|nr:1-acylglycerol-3-phosphate O-acyltransferase [Hahellaceae bacterium]
MLSLFRFVVLIPLAILASLTAFIVCLVRPFDPTNSRRAARIYGRFLLPLFGIKVEVKGWENIPTDREYVVVANHQSNFDLLVMGRAVPFRTVSIGKTSLKWVPLFGQVYWLSGNVLIDRARGDKAKATMEQTQTALQQGHKNIWVFVEGTRNPSDTLLPFKKGAFVTAVNCGAPVVRICSARYARKISWNRWKNGTIEIRILPPIETQGMGKGDVETLMAQCQSSMEDAISGLKVRHLPPPACCG